jgi:hypothetical protein
VQEIDEALMSKMSSEEEEAVQAELEALQREALVCWAALLFLSVQLTCVSLLYQSSRSRYHYRLYPWESQLNRSPRERLQRVSRFQRIQNPGLMQEPKVIVSKPERVAMEA